MEMLTTTFMITLLIAALVVPPFEVRQTYSTGAESSLLRNNRGYENYISEL
jgi:hypothetical protein